MDNLIARYQRKVTYLNWTLKQKKTW